MKKLILLLFIVFIIGGGLVVFKFSNTESAEDIKAHYNSYVSVNKDSYIYDKSKKKIGKIYDEISIALDKYDENSKYFKIKDSSLYVLYKDCKSSEKKNIDLKYLVFNKNVTTDKSTVFYQNGKKILKLDTSVSLPVTYMDEEFYHVNYLESDLQIKKSDSKIIDNKNTEKAEKKAFAINYGNLNSSLLNETINYLKENNYKFLNLDEYNNYSKGYIRFEDNYILLLGDNENSELSIYKNDSNIKSYNVSNINNLDEFKKIINSVNYVSYDMEVATSIPVLNYHFFYNEKTKNRCIQNICLDESKFREQLKYLKDNNFKTLTMAEFNDWMDGKINLPKKSVLITIDDGGEGVDTIAQSLLKEYDMNATLFLITEWWTKDLYTYEKLELHSHTHSMHTNGVCPQGQGGGIRCLDEATILADLKKSRDYLNNPIAMAYPFYEYNEHAINCVKKAGFSLAFVGGGRKATLRDNKYAVPRYPIHDTHTLESFISKVN